MNNLSSRRYNSGIGIIEVLITTLVIALGLLAVARFQLGIVGESRDNKAMVEARSYCESGIEDLRRVMSREGFDAGGALAENLTPTAENYSGKSASFSRTLMIENLPQPGVTTNADARQKRITATCSWADGEVELQTVMSLHDASNSALATNLGGGGGPALSPSLNAGSSDDISERIALEPGDEGYDKPGTVVGEAGDLYIVESSGKSASKSLACSDESLGDVLPFENGLRARRVDKDGYDGLEAIEIFEVVVVPPGDAGTEYCIPRVRFNGGVVIPIRGTVYSRIKPEDRSDEFLPVDLFSLDVSETGSYCVFKPDDPRAASANYTCYVGGNCAHGQDGVSAASDADFTKCPYDRPANILAKVGEGGWRGRIGFLNIASNDATDLKKGYNVCFKEEVQGQPLTLDTARGYFSYNQGTSVALTTDDRHQGINKPYACHDFLIIDQQANKAKLHAECEKQAGNIPGLKERLASKEIKRVVTGGYSNPYDPVVDVSNCTEAPVTEYTITVSILNPPEGALNVFVNTLEGTTVCTLVSAATYSCVFETSGSEATIGVSGYPDLFCQNSLDPLESSCTIEFPEVTGIEYRVLGFVAGTEQDTGLAASGGGIQSIEISAGPMTVPCTLGDYVSEPGPEEMDGRPYQCDFVAAEGVTSATLIWTAVSGYGMSLIADPELGVNPVALPVSGEEPRVAEGPTLLIEQLQTYVLSGNIRVGNSVAAKDYSIQEVGINTTESACYFTTTTVWTPGSTVGYECEIPAGLSQNIYANFTVQNSCPNGKNKLLLTSGGVSSAPGGALLLDLGEVTADLTRDVLIDTSNEKCQK